MSHTSRLELYDALTDPIATLVVLRDISMQCPHRSEVTIAADDLSQVLGNIVRQLKAAQQRLYD